jgi:15-cis-phytoene synthase
LPAPGLAHLYKQAAEATAQGSKSFYFATRFFTPDLAAAAHAVYWFCRYTDDLVDECANTEEGRRRLEEWALLLTEAARSNTTDHPVLSVFLDTVRRYEIPLEYPFELIEGMRMDLNQTRYETFEDLRIFCYRVASVVGLMMCRVIGFESPAHREKATPYAIDLGIALQLTNILRDIGEDLDRNRLYLPREDLRRFGYSEEDLLARRHTPAFTELMRFQAARARAFYESGNAGIPLLHRRGRFAVKVASDVYCEILSRMEASNFDVFDNRTVVPAARKYWLTARNVALPMARHFAPTLSQITQISSVATLLGLSVHYALHYFASTPLLTDQIAEWIMARTPSRFAVAILERLGPWAKPSAVTGSLALLGACLFATRLIPGRALALAFGVICAAGVAYSIGYHSLAGLSAFWIPALCFTVFAYRRQLPQVVSLERRALLMTGGVIAVAAESFLREETLGRRARQPLDLFPFQPPLARANFATGLVRKAVTPLPEFYGMSKDTVDPTIDPQSWRLLITIDGKPLRQFTYGELLGLPKQIRYVTLRCISNTLKSDLMGTAIWAGIHLSQLVDRSSLPSGVIEAAFIGVEGHDDSLRLDYAFSDEPLFTLGMNGKTLSRTHGFPMRLLAPNYYGCRNVKWLREIRFVTEPYYGTWQRLGYTKEPVIHICSHIDHVRRDGPLVQFGGVSFAGSRAIKAVRVRANKGPWLPARLEPALSPYTWTRWVAQLPATDGTVLEANAQDSTGTWQELVPGGPFPSGMSGPTIVVART